MTVSHIHTCIYIYIFCFPVKVSLFDEKTKGIYNIYTFKFAAFLNTRVHIYIYLSIYLYINNSLFHFLPDLSKHGV